MKIDRANSANWQHTIQAKRSVFRLNVREIIRYRDLIFLFVRRNVVIAYKQTILGPLWYLIQPLLSAVIFTIMFNRIANISTGTVPPFLFNLAGLTVWGYFRDCLSSTSDTFKSNEHIFGKVYFPRAVVPIAIVISNLMKFAVQMVMFSGFYLYYWLNGAPIRVDETAVLFPVVILIMGMMGLGIGMAISSLVTKYRDLTFLVQFGVQLLMYLSVVVYPLALVTEKLPKFGWLVKINPLSHVMEISRHMLLGIGTVSRSYALYAALMAVIFLVVGLVMFNRAERDFVDTI